jgi:hypothetical protein
MNAKTRTTYAAVAVALLAALAVALYFAVRRRAAPLTCTGVNAGAIAAQRATMSIGPHSLSLTRTLIAPPPMVLKDGNTLRFYASAHPTGQPRHMMALHGDTIYTGDGSFNQLMKLVMSGCGSVDADLITTGFQNGLLQFTVSVVVIGFTELDVYLRTVGPLYVAISLDGTGLASVQVDSTAYFDFVADNRTSNGLMAPCASRTYVDPNPYNRALFLKGATSKFWDMDTPVFCVGLGPGTLSFRHLYDSAAAPAALLVCLHASGQSGSAMAERVAEALSGSAARVAAPSDIVAQAEFAVHDHELTQGAMAALHRACDTRYVYGSFGASFTHSSPVELYVPVPTYHDANPASPMSGVYAAAPPTMLKGVLGYSAKAAAALPRSGVGIMMPAQSNAQLSATLSALIAHLNSDGQHFTGTWTSGNAFTAV